MAKFPEPPGVAALRKLTPDFRTLASNTALARIYFRGGDHPSAWNAFRHYGPVDSRWDPHLRDENGRASIQDRGVLYAACGPEAIPTCLAEVFQTKRLIDRHSRQPALAVIKLAAPLDLLDLTGRFTSRLGASTAMHSGSRRRSQRWSAQLYEAFPTAQGILYCSSMYGNAPALALFERAIKSLPDEPSAHRMLSDPALSQIIQIAAMEVGCQWNSR